MAKAIDLTGKNFGELIVLERDFEIQKEHPTERQAWWKCKCNACGEEKSLRASVIKKAKTCGCRNGIKKGTVPIAAIEAAKKNNKIDLTGQRFTRLLVLEEADAEHQVYYNGKHKVTWKCQCDCGNIHYATTENLRRGDTPSCGCITKENQRAKLKDLSGQRFGSLVVIERDYSDKKNAKWFCQCDCGKIVSKNGQGLRKGESTCCDRRTCPNKKELFENLRGQVFGRLIAVEPTKNRINKSVIWRCQCECGNEKMVSAALLKTGKTKSCGCLKEETDRMPKGNAIDMLNQKFGHLTVIARDGSDKNGQAKWLCECDCENHTQISVLGDNLRRGHTRSCGCERASHGEQDIAKILLEYHIPFETEVSFFNYENGHRAPFDFYINKQYLIEFDGETHDLEYAQKHGWCTEENIKKQLERDNIKNQWCKNNNIPLIRIPYTHLHNLCIEDLILETSKFVN